MPFSSASLSRRQAIVGSMTCLAGLGVAGCNKAADTPDPVVETRRDVPLKISLVGAQGDADVLLRGWASVSEQPITIEILEVDRADPKSLTADLIAAAKKSDLVGAPLMTLADLVVENAITSLGGDSILEVVGDLYPALRGGVARYSSEPFALPISSPLPAILTEQSDDATDSIQTWKDYDQVVQSSWKGKAGEPTADGWAAAMFLWRAANQAERWLFSRDNFAPLIEDAAYVDALFQMSQTVARYEQPRQTPAQIWQGLLDRKLMGGIGFPTQVGDSETGPEMKVTGLPSNGERGSGRPLFDPWTPVMAISANCRQTEASKTFLAWISGGEGSESVRRKLSPMNPVRISSESSEASEYSKWLVTQLQSPLTLPTLQVQSAGEYYSALETQVMRCLDGKATAQESLAEASSAWRAITERVGVEKQLRAWRRAQGMRA